MIKKIETDDAIYTVDESNGSCVDIDVKPGVNEIHLGGTTRYRKYLLSDNKKGFPDVRKIVINYSVNDIVIPNTLFPNVEEVECHSGNYGRYTKSGKMLLKNDSGQVLTNTFMKMANEIIDLKDVNRIADNAFFGCMATKIINSRNVTECEKDAFKNSAIGALKPAPGGVVVAGSIIVNIDETAEDIVLPDKNVSLTAMRSGISFDNVKSVTMNRAQTAINLQDKLPAGIRVILNDKSYITDEQLSKWRHFPVLELTEENPYYSTKDGCLLSKDGLVLVKYPSVISGTVHIPDGIETITPYAFSFSEAEEVCFPDSMRVLMPECFYMCKRLKKVDFGHGIEEIGIGHNCKLFLQCDMLCEIEIPSQVRIIGESAFFGTNISKVILHEGLTQIMDYAFKQTGVQDITLPASLKYIGKQNFLGINSITLSSDDMPYGIAEAITSDTVSDDRTMCIEIKKPNGTVLMPRYMVTADATLLDTRLSIPSFRKKCEESLYDYGMQPEIKWITAIKMMKECPNETVKTYLTRVSKNIVAMYLSINDETGLIDFVKLGVMTPKALNDAYKKAKEYNLTLVMAYICDAQKSTKGIKSSFAL